MTKPKTVSATKLRLAANACDGHTILDPAYFTKTLRVPEWFIEPVVTTHASDFSDHKQTLFVDGKPVSRLKGVYGLDLLWHIARHIGADTSRCTAMGRGSLARQLQEAINTQLAQQQTGAN